MSKSITYRLEAKNIHGVCIVFESETAKGVIRKFDAAHDRKGFKIDLYKKDVNESDEYVYVRYIKTSFC